jgi:hypothetical protein
MAAGPGIRQSLSLSPLSILDIAPMALHSLGLPIPVDMMGRVPVAAYDPSWLHAHPVQIAAYAESSVPASPQPTVEITYTEEEEAELAARLRALGYIE